MRSITTRLRRWCSIDAYAAIQEPGWRDEYNARAAAVHLLIKVMERVPGRTPHEALVILEEGLNFMEPADPTSDAPPQYNIHAENSDTPTGTFQHHNSNDVHRAITVPARPSRIATISEQPTIPPLPSDPKKY